MKLNFYNDRRGFTPIELMIVVLVIGVLALVSVTFLNTSRAKARDAKRLIDVRRIQTALEYYKLDYDSYPAPVQGVALGRDAAKLCDAESGALVAAQTTCQTEYMAPFPIGPQAGEYYEYIGAEAGYSLKFVTERESEFGPAGAYFAHSKTIDSQSIIK